MTDNVIRYAPDTDEVVFPRWARTKFMGHCQAHCTAKALHEAEQELAVLEATADNWKNKWLADTTELLKENSELRNALAELMPRQNLPLGAAPHPSLPEGEYLALGEDVRNLPDGWEVHLASRHASEGWHAPMAHNQVDAWFIVRRIPAPATKWVPWWECVDRVFAGDGRPIIDSIRVTAEDVRLYDLWGNYIGDPAIDGTVEVLDDAPASGSNPKRVLA